MCSLYSIISGFCLGFYVRLLVEVCTVELTLRIHRRYWKLYLLILTQNIFCALTPFTITNFVLKSINIVVLFRLEVRGMGSM